jgi:fluoride ion exporter CrcB/FEX
MDAMIVPLHGGFGGSGSASLYVTLAVAVVGSAALLGLATAALVRRQSRPYLLIAAAIGAVFARSAVGGLTMAGTFSTTEHHLIEHGLDVVLVALVIAAVYYARTATPGVESG